MRVDLPRLGAISDIGCGEQWSSVRLADEISRRTAQLLRRGIGRGANVVIAHGGTPAFFADLLAVWQTGACACCVSESLSKPELKTICEFVEADLVLSTAPLSSGSSDIPVADLGASPNFGGVAHPVSDSLQDDPALMLFTSGTTGIPKGVVHTFRSLGARLALNQSYIAPAERAVTLCPLPTHFGHGLIGNALTALLDGGHLLLPTQLGPKLGFELGDVLDRHGVTFMSSVPALWKVATKTSAQPKRGSLQRIHVGSAPLSADLWERIIGWAGTRRVFNMYGITETANWIAGISAEEMKPSDGLVGRLWGGAALVKTHDGSLRASGEGELIVSSPSLMSGYHKRADLTAEVCQAGWFHTGDVAHIDEHRVIRLTGRIKSEINRAGLKVYPEDIDLLLERNDRVLEACAFAVPDDTAGELIGVAIVPAQPEQFRLDHLREWTAKRLTREKLPDRWFVLPQIPKTERGKVNRSTVAAHCLALADRDEQKTGARGIIAQALDLAETDIPDDAAQGRLAKWDSLATIRVILETERLLDRPLNRSELASARSVRGVSDILRGVVTGGAGGNGAEAALQELVTSVKKAGFAKARVVFLLVSFDYCQSRGIDNPEDLIDRLLDELPRGANLVMSAFTWGFCRGAPYHHARSAAEVGLVNELFRRRTDTVRSQHPIYSYAAYGPDAAELMRQETSDSWGEGSVTWHLLNHEDVRTIQIGTAQKGGSLLTANTGLHALEQEARVPYRSMKSFAGDADFGSGSRRYTATMFVRNLDQCAASSWRPVDSALRERGLAHFQPDTMVYAYNNRDMRDVARELLRRDRSVFMIPARQRELSTAVE